MKQLFSSVYSTAKWKSLKVAHDETNTDYQYGGEGEVIYGTPDIPWDRIVFLSETKQIWNKGVFYDGSTVDTSNFVINGTNDNEVNIEVEAQKVVDTFKFGNKTGSFDETTTTDPKDPSITLPPTVEYKGVTYYKSTIYEDETHYFPQNKYTLTEGPIDMLLYGTVKMIISEGSISDITYVEEGSTNTITVNSEGAFYDDREIATVDDIPDTSNFVINGTNEDEVNITVGETKSAESFHISIEGTDLGEVTYDENDVTYGDITYHATFEYNGITYYKTSYLGEAPLYLPSSKYDLCEGTIGYLMYTDETAPVVEESGLTVSNITYSGNGTTLKVVDGGFAFVNDDTIITEQALWNTLSEYVVNGNNDGEVNILVPGYKSFTVNDKTYTYNGMSEYSSFARYHVIEQNSGDDFVVLIGDFEINDGDSIVIYTQDDEFNLTEIESGTVTNITGGDQTISINEEGAFYNDKEIATVDDIPDLSNYIEKSETEGLVKNDGTIDENTYVVNGENDTDVTITRKVTEDALVKESDITATEDTITLTVKDNATANADENTSTITLTKEGVEAVLKSVNIEDYNGNYINISDNNIEISSTESNSIDIDNDGIRVTTGDEKFTYNNKEVATIDTNGNTGSVYTQTQVDNLIGAISHFNTVIIQTSHEEIEKPQINTMYFEVLEEGSDADIWMWINASPYEGEEDYEWHQVGTTDIDFSQYATKQYVDDLINQMGEILHTINEGE